VSVWKAVPGIVKEIKKCEAGGSQMGAATLCYVAMDTMAHLGMAEGKEAQTRSDFIEWVDAFLRCHEDQPYKYRGIDVYAARCAVLHTYGTEAALHKQDESIKKFLYHSGGKHMLDEKVDPRIVILGLASFINDVVIALGDFLKACKADAALRARVEARLPKVLVNLPIEINENPILEVPTK